MLLVRFLAWFPNGIYTGVSLLICLPCYNPIGVCGFWSYCGFSTRCPSLD